MPYDPRQMQAIPYDPFAGSGQPWWQQQQQAPQAPQFGAPPSPQQQKQWYEGLSIPKDPYGRGQSANRPGQSAPPDDAKPPQPSLLQMLMLGGPATYSGTPRSGSSSMPWWFGSVGGGGPPR